MGRRVAIVTEREQQSKAEREQSSDEAYGLCLWSNPILFTLKIPFCLKLFCFEAILDLLHSTDYID